MACVLIQNIITHLAGFRIFSKEPLQESDIADLRHLGGLNMEIRSMGDLRVDNDILD